jgi:hypothetical protein
MEKDEVKTAIANVIIALSMDDHEKWKLDIDTLLKVKIFIEKDND